VGARSANQVRPSTNQPPQLIKTAETGLHLLDGKNYDTKALIIRRLLLPIQENIAEPSICGRQMSFPLRGLRPSQSPGFSLPNRTSILTPYHANIFVCAERKHLMPACSCFLFSSKSSSQQQKQI